MKRSSVLFLFVIASGLARAGKLPKQAEWQQKTTYSIHSVLDTSKKELRCKLEMEYQNNSGDTLRSIWFHLWPNAYSDETTDFARQMLNLDKTDFHFGKESDRGMIYNLLFRNTEIPDKDLAVHFHPKHKDIAELILNRGLNPGQKISLYSEFIVKLPYLYSRGGYSGNFYAITQWYPKPAVYDINGWNLIPYLDQGEFYSEFCSKISVSMTVPSGFTVAATGNCDTFKILKSENGTPLRHYVYSEKDVHDFAWFASPDFTQISKKMRLPGTNDTVLMEVYDIIADSVSRRKTALLNLEFAIKDFSTTVGLYPYKSCKLVLGPVNAGEGMEYPTIVICKDASALSIFHEVGHNWFYGILGSNERKYPWMDESINTYFSTILMNQRYPEKEGDLERDPQFYTEKKGGKFIQKHSSLFAWQITSAYGIPQSMNTESADFHSYNYSTVLYAKGPLVFAYLKEVLGDTVFNACIRHYFKTYAFKHPLPGDLQESFEKISRQNLDWVFIGLLNDRNTTDIIKKRKGFKVKGNPELKVFFQNSSGDKSNPNGFLPEVNYRNNTRKSKFAGISIPFAYPGNSSLLHLDIMPLPALNLYDKFYVGLLVQHHVLYKKGLQFSIFPAWSFSNQYLIGMSEVSSVLYRGNGNLQKMSSGFKVQSFSFLNMGYENRYIKWNPYLRFDFKPAAKSKRLMDHFIVLQAIRTGMEKSVYNVNDSIRINALASNFFHYLRAVYTFDNRQSINRYGIKIQTEYGYNYKFNPRSDRYIKSWLNAVYKYQYAKRKYFRTELYAAAFVLKEGRTERQQFFLSSNSGAQDYAFQELMTGRSENSYTNSFFGRQLIHMNGNMRNLIVLPSSDRWMLTLNSDVNIPGILPLKVFLDMGTYRYLKIVNPNNPNMTVSLPAPEFYYTFGMSLSVFRNTLEVFVPFVYSQQFKNYNLLNYGILNSIGFRLNLTPYKPDEIIKSAVLFNRSGLGDQL